MFVDASAMLAILNDEPEAASFAAALELAGRSITSPIAVFETTAGLCRLRRVTVDDAAAEVSRFLSIADIDCLPITAEDASAALAAFARYGKGRGHPAHLNLGDCFAYAAARRHGRALLFKGKDFTQTDIAPAGTAPPEPTLRPA